MSLRLHHSSPTLAFDHEPRTRLVCGHGTLARAGELARELGGQRALLVTDPGLVAAGHADHARTALTTAGLDVAVYDGVRENPTTLDVSRAVEAARAHRVDILVGLGGGSAMDTAKGCNFLFTNGGEMRDYWGRGKATRPMLPSSPSPPPPAPAASASPPPSSPTRSPTKRWPASTPRPPPASPSSTRT
ncbi:MAG: iron-containing alcohol dehydrogenase [Verrucomicrobia bacterium]|nr:iron-containing alcohol dehydrogenase [Verrucomicrobiota bacterium]